MRNVYKKFILSMLVIILITPPFFTKAVEQTIHPVEGREDNMYGYM